MGNIFPDPNKLSSVNFVHVERAGHRLQQRALHRQRNQGVLKKADGK